MSLYKGPDGIYRADVRIAGVGRWHGSMRTRKRAEAQPRYDAVRRLFREAKGSNGDGARALIEQLRNDAISIERLESMVAHREPLAPAVRGAITAWPTVDDARDRYLDWIETNPKRRKSTYDAISAQLKRFTAFTLDGVRIGSLPIDLVTSAQVEAYQRSLFDGKAAANTITGYMSRIGSLWRWMNRREQREANEQKRVALALHSPLDPETTSRETSARDRWLTKEEATALLNATPPRLRFAVAAGIFGGFRIGEILHLRTHVDVDLSLGTISIAPKQIGVNAGGAPVYWKPKTANAERVVPIGPDLMPVLEEQIALYASDNWLMPALEDPARPFAYDTFGHNFTIIVGNAGLIAGRRDPRGVVFHTLRHTFASWLVMSGIDLYTVAQLLGDTLTMVERTYAHLAPDFKRRAIEALKGAVVVPPLSEPEKAADKSASETATTEAR